MKKKDKMKGLLAEFVTKTQYMAYDKYGVCAFCGGGRVVNEFPGLWRPVHDKNCLYARAEALILK